MGTIDFGKTFGQDQQNQSNNRADQPKAQVWINIGYIAPGAGKDGEDTFVSLPLGIPLDTQEHIPTNVRNAEYGELLAERNGLLDQMNEMASKLAPGESKVFATESGLAIQIRRIEEARVSVVAGDDSRFAAARPKLVA